MSDWSPATRELLALLRSKPAHHAPLPERLVWVRKKARVLGLIAEQWEAAAGVEVPRDYAMRQAGGAREQADRAEGYAAALERGELS